LINISHLSFCYEGSYDPVFEDVSFQIDTDWKLGFCGRNGRGKTTFLRLLQGVYPCGGAISASVRFTYFPYPVTEPNRMTLDILAELTPHAAQWQVERELSKLDMPPDALYRPFDTLSNGERTKALLAALFLSPDHFLLIDEPTNHLDGEARGTVARYLSGKKGFILVSHDRAFLDACVDHILSINRTDIEVQSGNFSTWHENKRRQDAMEQARHDRLQKEAGKLAEASRRAANWSDRVEKSKKQPQASGNSPDRGYIGHQAARMMKRAKSIQRRRDEAVEEKAALLRNVESAEGLKLSSLTYHSPRLAQLDDVCVDYGGRPVCRGITFTVERGDRVALTGPNGSGKSSVIKLLLGRDIPHSGSVRLGSGLVAAYVPQDTDFLQGSLDDFAARQGADESLLKTILRKLDFTRAQFDTDMADYSAGQKKKVLIACSLCRRAHLYVWDEPLNYIDILSRMQIEDLILAHSPTLVFVEHDRAFCDRVATKTVLFAEPEGRDR
jgi:lincosamide and streptogramin A transport system ATP-binding/permease protein